jgi:hypothetical protein
MVMYILMPSVTFPLDDTAYVSLGPTFLPKRYLLN